MREIHPHADEDQVLRDGNCREAFYRHKALRSPPQCLLGELLAQYNNRFFDGALSAVGAVVLEDPGLPFVGRYGDGLIELNILAFSEGYEYFRDVLLHEMAHAYARTILGDTGEAHGDAWRTVALRLGVHIDAAFLEFDTPLESVW